MSARGSCCASGTAAEQRAQAEALVDLLLASLAALAAAGEVEAACRLAGKACVASRSADPAAARRFDVLLHRLCRTLTW